MVLQLPLSLNTRRDKRTDSDSLKGSVLGRLQSRQGRRCESKVTDPPAVFDCLHADAAPHDMVHFPFDMPGVTGTKDCTRALRQPEAARTFWHHPLPEQCPATKGSLKSHEASPATADALWFMMLWKGWCAYRTRRLAIFWRISVPS